MNDPKRTLLIVDEFLRDARGSNLNFIRGISAANQTMGVEVTVLTHLDFDPALLPEATVIPVFTRAWLDSYLSVFGWRRFLACLRHNVDFSRTLRRTLKPLGRWDVVLCTYANAFHLLGWKILWETNLRHRGTRLVMDTMVPLWVFRYDPDGKVRFVGHAPFVRWMYRRFQSAVLRARCAFVVETEHDARLLTDWSGVQVECIPTPRPAALIEMFHHHRDARSAGEQVTFVWLGRAAGEKGFGVFLDAITAVLQRRTSPKARFLIQWMANPSDAGEGWLDRLTALAAAHPEVETFDRDLRGEEYAQVLATSDCLVLPYRLAEYTGRNSSAALDAFCASVPIITTEGTWMAEKMATWGSGVAIPDQDTEALVIAIATTTAQIQALRQTARKNTERAVVECSWESFQRVLWGPKYDKIICRSSLLEPSV